MSKSIVEWRNLKKSLTYSLSIVSVCCLSVGISYQYMHKKKLTLNTKQGQLNQINSKITQANNNLNLLNQYHQSYNDLIANRFVGKEDRLNWIETLQHSSEKFLIPMIKYKINKRTRFDASALSNNLIGLSLYKTEMIVGFELLHEADAFNLFDQLKEDARGLFTIEECHIKSILNEGVLSHLYNLDGRCTLNWYTVEADTQEF